MIIELAACESVIRNEIENGLKRKDIAMTYALAMRSSWPTDWAEINKAIIERWSMSGLEWIKKEAWKLASRAAKESDNGDR